MTRVALKGLLGRKLRAALTALAIVLGVAMVSGSFVLTDTISKAFDSIFSSPYDAHRRRRQRQEARRLLVERQRDRLARAARADPGVSRRRGGGAGAILDMNGDSTQAKLIGRDGKAIHHNGARPSASASTRRSRGSTRSSSTAGPLGAGPRRGRDRPRDGREARTSRVGDTIGVAANGPVRAVQDRRAREVRRRRVARRRDVRRLHDPDGAARCCSMRRLHGDLGRGEAGRRRGRGSSRELQPVCPGDRAGADGRRAGGGRRAGHRRRSHVHPRLPARLRRDRALRRRVRHLQHAVDHGRAADAGARDAAHARRHAAPGAALGRSSSRSRSALLASVGRALRAASGSRRGCSSLFGALGLALPEAAPRLRARTRSSSRSLVGVARHRARRARPGACGRRGSPPIAAARERRRRRAAPAAGADRRRRAARARGWRLLGYAVPGDRLGSGTSLLALAVGALALLSGTAGVASRLVAALAGVVGWPSRRLRRRRRPARLAERRPQPAAHRVDGRRADDRPRARLVRRRARQGRARLDRPTRSSSSSPPTGSSRRRTAGRPSRSRPATRRRKRRASRRRRASAATAA